MARIFKRGLIYYAWVPRIEGGTEKKTTNCTDPVAARARAAELEREALDPDGAAAKKATLRDALGLLIRDRSGKAKAGKGSTETVDFYRKKSGVLLDGLAEVLRRSPRAEIFIHEMKAGVVDDYIAMRRADGAKDSTIGKELTTWRAAMRIAKRRGWLRVDIDVLFPPGFSGASEDRDRWVTPEEFLKLHDAFIRPVPVRQPSLEPEKIAELRARRRNGESLRALAKEYNVSYPTVTRLSRREEAEPREATGHALFAIVCFAIATTSEWSAIWRARRTDIAPDRREVKVRGSKNEARRNRPVPIELLPFGMLLDFAARHGDGDADPDGEGEFLFKASHASSFRHRLREACTRAGIPALSPTDLRRTHAQWLRRSGVAPANIAPSMGHKDSRMVERKYGKATAAELAGVQRAQLAVVGAGLLMGGAPGKPDTSGPLRAATDARFASEKSCPGTESNRRHGDFQSPPTSQETSREAPTSPTSWAANGQLASPPRTAAGEAELDWEVRSIPLSGAASALPAPPEDSSARSPLRDGEPRAPAPAPCTGPGVAKAEVDGRQVFLEEELSDLAAVFPLARGAGRP